MTMEGNNNQVKPVRLVIIVASLVGFVTMFNLRYSMEVGGALAVKNTVAEVNGLPLQPTQSTRIEPTPVEKEKPKQIDVSAVFANVKVPKGISPDESIAPEAMTLFDTDNEGVRKRHECIVKIRESAHQLLDPHLQSFAQSQRSVLIVDPAFHANVGDNMIYQGELGFLKPLGYEGSSVEHCGYAQSESFAKIKCKIYLQDDNTGNSFALWHGGGNWGDLWRRTHAQRIPSFETLLKKNFTVIAMPSSFHYASEQVRQQDTVNMKKYIASGIGRADLEDEAARNESASRVVFSWRERKSFEEATKEYPFATNLLVPDIAFHLGPYEQRQTKQKEDLQLDILLFLRTDKESVVSSTRSQEGIQQLLSTVEGGDELRFGIVDWNSRFALWPSDDYLFTESAIQMLSLGKVVICDRLHASILCYLSGIPFVYIDQVTGKISNTLEVAFSSWDGCKDGETAMFARAHTLQEAVEIAASFIEKYNL